MLKYIFMEAASWPVSIPKYTNGMQIMGQIVADGWFGVDLDYIFEFLVAYKRHHIGTMDGDGWRNSGQ